MSAGANLGGDIARAIDISALETPCFVTDLGALEKNLQLLADVQRRAECTILLALKGFAQWSTFPLVREYLAGATSSSVAEARLAREELGGEVHAYAPGYSDGEMRELVTLADHVVLNSPAQWRRHRATIERAGLSAGLRVNHEHQEVEVALYDPAGPCSRLGTTRTNLTAADLDGIDGLHFHTLCQVNSDALAPRARAQGARAPGWRSCVRLGVRCPPRVHGHEARGAPQEDRRGGDRADPAPRRRVPPRLRRPAEPARRPRRARHGPARRGEPRPRRARP